VSVWRVYPAGTVPASVPGERAARRLARKYVRLNVRCDLYEEDEAGEPRLRVRMEADGTEALDSEEAR